ncbi:hypothetical protein [Halomarina oriensis]|uniref:Uncharacterized protein n=1 Tax=Halomarina oriensis TaxID=671145 RepID=A0A6B0GWF4_9EURY|nr:hypothetical protein [Halomarina oriensis]MWG36475.1 hypothetical protein [Halomarina oriensis]
MALPIDDYDDLTVSEVRSALRERDFSDAELQTLREYEADNKARSTVLEELPDADAEAEDTPDDAEGDADADADGDDVDAEAEDAGTSADTDENAPETVRISPQTSVIAGNVFRTLYTPVEVELTDGVEAAIRDGRARRVDDED